MYATQIIKIFEHAFKRAGLADLLSGSQLGAANGEIGLAAGLGVIVGPYLGATIDHNFGPATTYAVSSAIGFGTAAYVHTNFQDRDIFSFFVVTLEIPVKGEVSSVAPPYPSGADSSSPRKLFGRKQTL